MPPDTPILLRIAVITALVVPTMSYLVSPQITRLFNAEIRGRKIGDTFPVQSSIFPVFFPGSSG
jgi:hypothetical protein